MTSESQRWSTYADAVLHIASPRGWVRVRPAPLTRTSGDFPDPDGRVIYVITAHNPGGEVADDTANAAAQARLEAELDRRHILWWPAAGGDPSWTHVEPSAAVLGLDPDEARELGAAYGQEAVFALTPFGRQILDCQTSHYAASGWSIENLDNATAATTGACSQRKKAGTPSSSLPGGAAGNPKPPTTRVTLGAGSAKSGEQPIARDAEPDRATACFDSYESAKEHADMRALKAKRQMAVVEDEGEFYVMTVRQADIYARPHPETVFIVYHTGNSNKEAN